MRNACSVCRSRPVRGVRGGPEATGDAALPASSTRIDPELGDAGADGSGRDEREIRDAEMLMDGQSLRNDIVRLQRATGMQLSAPKLEDMLTGMGDDSAAAKLQGALFLKGIEGSPVPSHTKLL